MTTAGTAPAVWALFDQHDQDAAIAATLGLRRAANEHRCAGRRRDANELDQLADELELIVEKVRGAYRESHPPGEKAKARTAANDASLPGEAPKRTCGDTNRLSPSIVPTARDREPGQ